MRCEDCNIVLFRVESSTRGVCLGCWQHRIASAGSKQSEPPPVYTIPARDVVPGMILIHGGTAMPITGVRRTTEYPIEVITEYGDFAGPLDTEVFATLPGPSPLKLCCACVSVGQPRLARAIWPANAHDKGCPVAPVEGLHGGMRLWPAPSGRVAAWRSRQSECGWDGREQNGRYVTTVGATQLMEIGERMNPEWCDLALMAFYDPPQAKQHARAAGDGLWDPYGTDIDLAGRWG